MNLETFRFNTTRRKCNEAIAAVALAMLVLTTSPAVQAAPGGVAAGLQVWLRAGAGISVADGDEVILWADSSGNANDAVWNPANIYGEQPPVFNAMNAGANDKATVRFNNTNALELDLSWLAGSDYTIFIVNARDRYGLANFYIAGTDVVQDTNLVLGYEQPNLLRQAHFNRDLDASVENYIGTPLWVLDTFRFAQAEGKDLFQNGELLTSDDATTALVSNNGTTLGHFRAFGDYYWFQGDLAEVVVYNRALSDFERMRVESELAVRYGLPVDVLEYIPCGSDWRNHGEYVSTLARLIEMLVNDGLLTAEEGEAIVSTGAESGCGK